MTDWVTGWVLFSVMVGVPCSQVSPSGGLGDVAGITVLVVGIAVPIFLIVYFGDRAADD